MSNNFVMAITPSSATISNGIIIYTYTLTMDAVAPVDEPIDFVIRGVGNNPASLEELTRYQELNQTITFKPGETIKTFNVKVPAAAANQAEKTFEVKLTSSLAWVTPDPQKDSVVSLVSTTPKNGDLKFLNGRIFSTTPSASDDYVEVTEGQSISTLAGNDKVITSGIVNKIDTGVGNDEVVVNNGGGIIALGDGNDMVQVANYSGLLNMDGGKGIDTLDLSKLKNIAVLRVDERGEINISNAFDLSAGKLGIAKGFEKIIGTDSLDSIATGKGITMIDGGGGNDNIISNTGNDQLDGGDGDDSLSGGRGADILTGGEGNDVFQFASIKDLNKSEQKTDTITDFTLGVDRLSIGFDLNTKLEGDQLAGEFIGNSPFTKVAGQIRYYAAPSPEKFILVQGDTNGDGNLDWMIKLLGISTITKEDFLNAFTN
jgi:Ca2+-binding RTX toxin-like protein